MSNSQLHCVAAVCSALTAICKLISPDLINAVLPRTLELLTHPKELVRKKAVMALDRYLQLDPERDGPLAGVDLDRHLRQALCDKASACAIVICLELVTGSFCTHAEPAEQEYDTICIVSLSMSHGLQDPSVMSAALCALQETIQRDPKPYKNLIPSFVSILKQVSLATALNDTLALSFVQHRHSAS